MTVNPLGVALGASRVLGSAARAMTLDMISATARAGEAVRDRADGGPAGPATLPVRVLILSDEEGRPLTTVEAMRPALDRADEIFRSQADIRIRVVGVDTAGEPAPARALDPRSNRLLLLDHVLGHTRAYRDHLARRPVLSVVGDPVTVVVVRNISGRTTGCSLGMTADWVICQASLFDVDSRSHYDETVLAHELGHALNLPHLKDPTNLMFPMSSPPGKIRGTELRRWQAAVLRANRHTVPPPPRTHADR